MDPENIKAWAGAITAAVMGVAWGVWTLLKKAGLVSVAKTETKALCDDADCNAEFKRLDAEISRLHKECEESRLKFASLDAKYGKTVEELAKLDSDVWGAMKDIEKGLNAVDKGLGHMAGLLEGRQQK